MKRKILCCVLIVLLISTFVQVDARALDVTDFNDIAETSLYYAAIEYVVKNNWLGGTSANTFSPDTPMTRAMFITALGRLHGVAETYISENASSAVDTTNYYYPYVEWAYDNQLIMREGSTEETLNNNITFEQMVTILFRYAENKGLDTTYSNEKYNVFSDIAAVSEYAVIPMQWATTRGIVNGADNKLNPQTETSRAQAAHLLFSFSQLEVPKPYVERRIDHRILFAIGIVSIIILAACIVGLVRKRNRNEYLKYIELVRNIKNQVEEEQASHYIAGNNL